MAYIEYEYTQEDAERDGYHWSPSLAIGMAMARQHTYPRLPKFPTNEVWPPKGVQIKEIKVGLIDMKDIPPRRRMTDEECIQMRASLMKAINVAPVAI